MFKSGKKKSSDADDENKKPSETSIKKAKSFRRIRGLLTGESRRKKKAEKLAAANAAHDKSKSTLDKNIVNSDDEGGDDESTIYGVQVDENASVATGVSSMRSGYSTNQQQNSVDNGGSLLPSLSNDSGQTADGLTSILDSKRSYILKVVLLLMDPSSRRFELLQLEFDSLKALVSDVLAQIPISVTEAALREQNYIGICGVDAKEMTSGQLLSDFCVGNEVLVAMPNNVAAKECVRLARPILSDEKVISMVRECFLVFY
jgi:hypothetical protein